MNITLIIIIIIIIMNITGAGFLLDLFSLL